ncbi:MAG: beta strand repeat-containing protein [Verrucomicrobiaceae bacterium]
MATNWSSGAVPTGAHTATFDGAGNGNVEVTFVGTQPIGNITIDTTDAAAYSFGGAGADRFRLRAGGTILMTASVVNDQTFENTVALGINDDPSIFNILNESTSASLILNGVLKGDPVAGGNGVTVGTKNLNIGGEGAIVLNGAIENTAGTERKLGLTKVGAGSLTVSNAGNVYTGYTRITEGSLMVPATGTIESSEEVIVSAGAVLNLDPTNGHRVAATKGLGGGGSISGGPIIVESGGVVAMDEGVVGTLTVENLELQSGWLGEFELSEGGASDLVDVLDEDGLVMNDGSVSLYELGTKDAFATPGTYLLFQYENALGGTPVLSVANPAAGASYSFDFTGGTVAVTVSVSGSNWDSAVGGSWNMASNWTTDTAPNGQGSLASFGGGGTAITSASTVSLDGDKTVGKLIFDSVESFTVVPGSPDTSSITFDVDGAAPILQGISGSHEVAADLVIPAGFQLQAGAGSELTLSGGISGDGSIDVVDGGVVFLSRANSYRGATTVLSGTLNIRGDQRLANAGYEVGTTVVNPVAVLNVESGAIVESTAPGGIFVGNQGNLGDDTDVVELNVAGTVTSTGQLGIHRAGDVNIKEGGVWNQSANVTLRAWGNIAGANLTVEEGGRFVYTGNNTIKVNGPQVGAAQNGVSTLTIRGEFLTSRGFEEAKTGAANPGNGYAQVVIDGGMVQITEAVPDLVFGAFGDIRLVVENDAVIDTNGFDSSVSAVVSGNGNLIKTGAGKLTLTGGNTYLGGTTVAGGTLEVSGNSISDSGILILTGGGQVSLTQDETVNTLYFGDFPQNPGTYGSEESGAEHVDRRFTGTGKLTVLALGDFNGIIAAEFTDIQVNASGDVTLTWASQPDGVYLLNYSENLTDWLEVDDAILAEGASTSFTVLAAQFPSGFGPEKAFFQVKRVEIIAGE